ncbi:MAG: DUF192 domain-containing protein [Candidatus Dadabacteria bacterium]|nr:DUF192 domain-containing protein [Candidatus Dadabacteria bacterium]
MIKQVFLLLSLVLADSSSSLDSYLITLPNGIKIKAEVAIDKEKGLQGRKSLCPDCGMVFVYKREGFPSFWMKDTLIDLAMIWIDEDGKIVHIVNAKPCVVKQNPYTGCTVYTPPLPARYVLEVNPKAAKGIQLGMKIKSEPPL